MLVSSSKANISNKNKANEMNQKTNHRERMYLDDKIIFKFLAVLTYSTGCFKLSPKYQHFVFPRIINRWGVSFLI